MYCRGWRWATLASLAANIAVGAVELIGRAVAGWPAIALLVAIKMLASLLDSGSTKDTSELEQPAASTAVSVVADDPLARRHRKGRLTRARSGTARVSDAAGPNLEAAARAALAELTAAGQRLSRDSLTRALRAGGHTVSNAKAGELLTLLRQTQGLPANGTRPELVPADGGDRDA